MTMMTKAKTTMTKVQQVIAQLCQVRSDAGADVFLGDLKTWFEANKEHCLARRREVGWNSDDAEHFETVLDEKMNQMLWGEVRACKEAGLTQDEADEHLIITLDKMTDMLTALRAKPQ
jgi:hypothetical protein